MDLNDNTGDAGSIADLIGGGGDGGDGGADPNAGGGDSGADPNAGGGDPGAGGDVPPDFLALFPTDTGEGESASLQDWVKAVGAKDAATLAKIARDNQRALRESGRIKVPGENATEQEIAEYRAAIGVPEKPEDYARPEFKDANGNPVPYNTELTDRIFAAAHEIGLPKTAAEKLVAGEIQRQIEEYDAAVKQLQADANAHLAKWGPEKELGIKQVNAALQELGLTRQDVDHMRAMPSGVGKFLDAMRKVGSNFTEDTLIKGDRQTFGMTREQAQSEIDAMKANPEIAMKVRVPGTPERQKWDRLNAIASQGSA